MIDPLSLFFISTTIIGIVLTVYYGRKSIELEKSKKKLEWSDLQSCANDLGSKLKQRKSFLPKIIFTPGLRGATFANLLLGELDHDVPIFVGISSWKDNPHAIRQINGFIQIETKKWYVYIPESILDFTGQNLLILDDFAMSGDFLEKVRDLLISKGFESKNIKTMCIATTKVAVHNHKSPDYFWMETTDDNFYFPWGKAK
jgi:hypoxanthine phosphoribosyltransferase